MSDYAVCLAISLSRARCEGFLSWAHALDLEDELRRELSITGAA